MAVGLIEDKNRDMRLDFARVKLTSLLESGTSRKALGQGSEGSRGARHGRRDCSRVHEATRVTTGRYPATGPRCTGGLLQVAALGAGSLSFDSRRPHSRPQNVETTMVEIGIDSFAATIPDPASGRTLPAADRMKELLAEVGTADRAGLDVFGIGEHHRKEFLDSALPPILAAAARIKRIRLTSAVRRDLSTLAHPKCTSRVTASVLWDKASRHVVSNESAEILRAWGVAR